MFSVRPAWFLLLLLGYSLGVHAQTVETFSYTGSAQNWVVPPGVTEVSIEAWGGQGADAVDRLPDNGGGGLGGYASGTLTVTPGETLAIYVGGAGEGASGAGGFNGGAAGGYGSPGASCSGGFGGGGGGASDVRQGGSTLADRVIVAGGGGGGGRDYCNGTCQPCGCGGSGGTGGALLGDDGTPAFNCGFGYPGTGINFGGGATQLLGGTGGPAVAEVRTTVQTASSGKGVRDLMATTMSPAVVEAADTTGVVVEAVLRTCPEWAPAAPGRDPATREH